MKLLFFSLTDNFTYFHRRPFLEHIAEALVSSGNSAIYFTQPQWLLSRRANPADQSTELITVRSLFTLLPLSLCLGKPFLMYLFVGLPVRMQVAWYTRPVPDNQAKIAWIFKPDQYLYVRALGLPYVYDQYDNYAADESYAFAHSAHYPETFKACMQASAFNIAVSQKLIQKYAAVGHFHYVPCAVDQSLINDQKVEIKSSLITQSNLHPETDLGAVRTVIGYVGTIDQSIDAALIERVCIEFPDAELRLIGPCTNKSIEALSLSYPNLNLLGWMPYQRLGTQVAQFSVAICPYASNSYNAFRNPLKLYEYCAHGVASVASTCDFDQQGRKLVSIVDSPDAFIEAIKVELSSDSAVKVRQRIAFARANTWGQRADQVKDLLAQVIAKDLDVIADLLQQTSIAHDYKQAIAKLNELLAEHASINIGFVNAHAYNLCARNLSFAQDLKACDVLLRDGIGVKLLYRLVGRDPGCNLNGTDFIPEILSECFSAKRIAILGATDAELALAKGKIEDLGLDVVYCAHGFYEPEAYSSLLEGRDVEVVLLAMGMPKQERVAVTLRQNYSNISVINGGAIVDFLAGKVSRAPAWMRRFGMEWCYRLCLEPRRLFNRYVLGNVLFIMRALRFKRSGGNTCEL